MRVNVTKDGKITIADFNPAQAYKIAVKMEKDGIAFYKDLEEKAKDKDVAREIGFLIAEEQAHLKTFEAFLQREKETRGDPFEEDDIVDAMNARVFDATLEKNEASRMEHRHTALEEALHMERRSIVFYDGIVKHVSDTKARQAFQNIIEEERRHLTKFAELLRIKCIDSGEGCLL